MFVTLFVLLLVAQPVKGPQAKPRESDAAPKQAATQNQNPPKSDSTPSTAFHYADSCTSNSKAAKESESEKIERDVANYTGLLVAVTFILACLAFWQGKIARQTMRRGLRAYLAVEPNAWRIAQDFPPISVKNYGQTPAYDVVIWICGEMKIPANAIFGALPEDRVIRRCGTIHPTRSDGQKGFVFTPTGAISGDDLHEFTTTDTHSFFLYGAVTYKDCFKLPRHTDFRFQFGPLWANEGGEITYPPIPTEDGNDSD